MEALLTEIRACEYCSKNLPLGPRPVVSAAVNSKVIIIGQAPGTAVHSSGIPWDDKSGENLRSWLGVTATEFYDPENFGIIPMGFCYPGKGKSGDLPPRSECAPLWHYKLFAHIKAVKLTLLVGKYAQDYYLPTEKKINLTEKVRNYQSYLPEFLVLPHPSPRNNIWQAKNPWFQKEVVPTLKNIVKASLAQ